MFVRWDNATTEAGMVMMYEFAYTNAHARTHTHTNTTGTVEHTSQNERTHIRH